MEPTTICSTCSEGRVWSDFDESKLVEGCWWKDKFVQGSNSPQEHFNYVWNKIIQPSGVPQVAIIAHSAGGQLTVQGAATIEDVHKRTFAVAFTDSSHQLPESPDIIPVKEWLKYNCCNWVQSRKKIDEQVCLPINNCPCVSAGTIVHEETSWKAFNSVWTFIEEKLDEQNNQNCVKKNVQFEEDTKENLVNVPDGVKMVRTNMVSKRNTIQEAHSESRQVDNDVGSEVRKLIEKTYKFKSNKNQK